MFSRSLVVAAFVLLAALAGCSADVSRQMTTSTETQTKVMDTIASNQDMAGGMMDRLMASDTTRAIVMDKVMANGDVMQGIMNRISRDPTMLDGVINMAAQDSLMRDHMTATMKSMGATAR